MKLNRYGFLLLVAICSCLAGVFSAELFTSKPALAQDSDFDKRMQQLHEEKLALMGVTKIQSNPIDSNRCIGISVVAGSVNGPLKVFRAFEDGKVEQFKAIGGWGAIDRPGYSP